MLKHPLPKAQRKSISIREEPYHAKVIRKYGGVELMEFGIPEAMWKLRVRNFPAIVTMDAHGNSLHADVEKQTGNALEEVGAQK